MVIMTGEERRAFLARWAGRSWWAYVFGFVRCVLTHVSHWRDAHDQTWTPASTGSQGTHLYCTHCKWWLF